MFVLAVLYNNLAFTELGRFYIRYFYLCTQILLSPSRRPFRHRAKYFK